MKWSASKVHSWSGVSMFGLVLVVPLTLPINAEPPPAVQTAPAVATAGIEIRVEPLMALHSWVRGMAEGKGEPPPESGATEAVAVARRLAGEFGGGQGWGMIDGLLVGEKDAAALSRLAGELAAERQLRGGGVLHLRAGVRDLAAAYAKMEPRFLAETWPSWKKELDRTAEQLRATFVPKLPRVWMEVGRHLDLGAPEQPVPVYLVVEAPFPGAVTFRDDKGPVVAISLGAAARELHEEITLHELIHSLDVLNGESVLTKLRSRLESDPGSSFRTVHDFVHTLMFAEAAGTVRLVFDLKHRDYGEVAGYYPKVPDATEVVVPAWRAYLEGKLTREAALDRIAVGYAAKMKAEAKTKGGPEAAPKPKTEGGS